MGIGNERDELTYFESVAEYGIAAKSPHGNDPDEHGKHYDGEEGCPAGFGDIAAVGEVRDAASESLDFTVFAKEGFHHSGALEDAV